MLCIAVPPYCCAAVLGLPLLRFGVLIPVTLSIALGVLHDAGWGGGSCMMQG